MKTHHAQARLLLRRWRQEDRCRHRDVWVIGREVVLLWADLTRRDGQQAKRRVRVRWCYRCGAIRLEGDKTRWQRPVGPTGKMPART